MHRSDTSPSQCEFLWPELPCELPRGDRGVLVVAAELRSTPTREHQIERWLSPDERHRAGAFSQPDLRRRFISSRGVLREVLARYAGTEPGALAFNPGANGKPALEGHAGLHFNLAHSADLMLLAVGTCGELGVDVEQCRPMTDSVAIARRFFTAREAAWLEKQPLSRRDPAFFGLWTRKEALLKACGLGIAHGLERLEVIDEDGAWRHRISFPGPSALEWTLEELKPAEDCIGAVALPLESTTLWCHRWPTEPRVE